MPKLKMVELKEIVDNPTQVSENIREKFNNKYINNWIVLLNSDINERRQAILENISSLIRELKNSQENNKEQIMLGDIAYKLIQAVIYYYNCYSRESDEVIQPDIDEIRRRIEESLDIIEFLEGFREE